MVDDDNSETAMHPEEEKLKLSSVSKFKAVAGHGVEGELKIKNAKAVKEIVNKLSRLKLINTESEIKGDAF